MQGMFYSGPQTGDTTTIVEKPQEREPPRGQQFVLTDCWGLTSSDGRSLRVDTYRCPGWDGRHNLIARQVWNSVKP